MKKHKKVKNKLQTSLLLLSFLEPIYYHSLKNLQENKKTQILRIELKRLKILFKKFFFGIMYNGKTKNQEELILVKNFLFGLNNFFSNLNQTNFYSIKQQVKKKKSFSDQSLSKEKSIQILTFLEDLLNV